jgi:integrase
VQRWKSPVRSRATVRRGWGESSPPDADTALLVDRWRVLCALRRPNPRILTTLAEGGWPLYRDVSEGGAIRAVADLDPSLLHAALFAWACDWGVDGVPWLLDAALHSMSLWARSDRARERKTWDSDEAGRFLEAAETDGYSPLWLVLLSTGLRRGEALGVRWQDLDFDRRVLTVRQSVVACGGAPLVQEPKSKAATRTVRLPEVTVAALREHRKSQVERRLAPPAWQDNDLVFCRGRQADQPAPCPAELRGHRQASRRAP